MDWLLIALQVTVGKVPLFAGKLFVVRASATKTTNMIIAPRKLPVLHFQLKLGTIIWDTAHRELHMQYVLAIIMPRCACASEVYGSVFVCLCV